MKLNQNNHPRMRYKNTLLLYPMMNQMFLLKVFVICIKHIFQLKYASIKTKYMFAKSNVSSICAVSVLLPSPIDSCEQ